MFQLSKEQTDKIFNGTVIMVAITVVLCVIGMQLYMIIDYIALESDPYSDACWQMKEHFAGLSRSDCSDYLHNNPGATGQDMLDHYNILTIEQIVENPVDDLLENPIIPAK